MAACSGPLLDKAEAYAIAIDVADGLTLDALATCADGEAAGRVADTIRAVARPGRNALPESPRRPAEAARPRPPRPLVDLVDALDAMLEHRQGRAGRTTSGSAPRPTPPPSPRPPGCSCPPPRRDREAARRAQSINNLKQIGLAMHNYHPANDCFPPAVLYGPDGKTPYSWRVAILPYLEQNDALQRIQVRRALGRPEQPQAHRQDARRLPLPRRRAASPTPRRTSCSPAPTPCSPTARRGSDLQEITDGTSNTILVVEAKRDIPWTKPEDIPFDPEAPLPGSAGSTRGLQRRLRRRLGPVPQGYDRPDVLQALFTRAGGEVLSLRLLSERGRLPSIENAAKRATARPPGIRGAGRLAQDRPIARTP